MPLAFTVTTAPAVALTKDAERAPPSMSESLESRLPLTKMDGETVDDDDTCSCVLPMVSYASPTTTGGSLTGLIVITNDCVAEVSAPPLAVPPSSLRRIVMVAVPNASGADV